MNRTARLPLLALIIGVFCGALGACQALAGIDDRTYDPNGAGPTAQCKAYCALAKEVCTGTSALYATDETCYGVCKLLDNQQQARVESNYQNALRNNAAITDGWVGASSRRYVLAVARPQPTPGQPSCRTVNATLDVNGQGPQQLPTETYCNNGGGWAPVA